MSDNSYIYTLDPPLNTPAHNKRLGYRTPRSILLPPYLLQNQYYIDWANGIDAVFQDMLDKPLDLLQNIRNMWLTNPTLERQIDAMTQADGSLVTFDEWSQPERSMIIRQVNNLGMRLTDSAIVSTDSYLAIARFVGSYWFAKGTQAFIEFINFCLGTNLTVTRLWTEDYDAFLPDGSPGIGTPIWDGGTWYPTTHVAIVSKGGLGDLDPDTLVQFFYEIANYNLVLDSIDASFDMPVVDDLNSGRDNAEIVALAVYCDNNMVLSNVASYGLPGPDTHLLQSLPTKVYTNVPAGTNFGTQYLLASPNGWMEDVDGDLIPLYDGVTVRAPTVDTFVPTSLIGGDSTTGVDLDPAGYTLLYGPVTLVPVPGTTASTRIPVFPSTPVLRTGNTNFVTSRILGSTRSFLLVNPKGFKPLNGDATKIVPYW